jgi:phosphoglycolate phosphatase
VLWDVDGTLLNAGGVGGDLYSVVFLQLFGRPLETTAPMAGRTDRAIILETLTLAGVPEPRRHVDPFVAGLAAQAPTVRTLVAARGRALPGAAAALAALASGRVHQSVLTGNVRAVAEAKLAALGLRDPLDLCIGAYGDDNEDRAELVHVARRRAAAAHERSGVAGFGGRGTVVIGDTPLDIAAALAAGARAVGVATGPFSVAELCAAGADVVLPDLADTRLVMDALLSRLRRSGVRLRGAAGRGAGPWLPLPAAAGERAGDLRRRAAGSAGNVVPVVAQRRAAAGRGVVVAAAVLAAPFRGVRLPAVQLDDQPVCAVVPVAEAAAAVGLGERHLTGCPGQPVRALDVAVVTELEQRVRSPGRRDDHLVELPAPAKLPARAQRRPQRPLPRQPPPERGSHPPAGLIEAARGFDEVDDRLLDERVRHHPPRKPRLEIKVRGQVYFHSVRRADPPVRRYGHVNEPRLAFGEPIHLGGCLVAKLSPFARIKHSGRQLRIPPHRPAKGRVYTQVDLVPVATCELPFDRARG